MKRLGLLIVLVIAACGDRDLPDMPPRPDLGGVEALVKKAIEDAYATLEKEPTVANFEAYARVAQAHGLGDDALRVWEDLIARRGSNFEREYLAGRAVFLVDRDRARRHFEAALGHRPDYWPAKICLGEILEEAGETDRAEALFREAEPEDDSGTVPFALARIAFGRGDLETALTELERARRIAPEHRPILNLDVQILSRLGREEEARAISERLAAETEKGATSQLKIRDEVMSDLYKTRVSFLGLVVRAEAARSAGDDLQAAKLFEMALEAKPGENKLLSVIGQCYHHAGELEKARESYRRFLEFGSRDPDVLYELARCEFQLRNVDEGIRLMNEAKDLDPDNLDARRLLAIALWNRDAKTATVHLRYLLLKRPDDIQGNTLMARILLDAGRRDEGRKHLERVLAVDAGNQEALRLRREFFGE